MSASTAKTIASRFPGRWDRHYIAGKIATDPLYPAVLSELRDSTLPLLDLGCGLGLLSFFLRENGVLVPIHGLDYDAAKIDRARRASAGDPGLAFDHHDARTGLPGHSGNVTILDILQFFTPAQQQSLLTHAVSRLAPGGKLVIRSGLRDRSTRFRLTVLGDLLAKATSWMKAAPIHYPTAAGLDAILSSHGTLRVAPLWGRTPFNNYLVVLEKT